jgi:hypothetical protein
MRNKFLTLVENNITRYTNGSILVGDIVKLADGYKSSEHFKDLSKDTQNAVEEFFKANDLNKRVVNIKTYYPTSAPNNDDNRGTCFTAEVAVEIAPGRYYKETKIAVPSFILTRVNVDGPNLAPIPNSLKKQERRNLKPVAPEENEEAPNNPYLQTMMSQDGNKLSRGDRALLNKNVTIPSSPAKGMNSPMVAKQKFIALPTSIKL